MKLVRTFALVSLLGMSGSAFADDAKPVVDPKAVPADYTAKYLVFFDSVIGQVMVDKDDCSKMGDDLTTLFTANDALLAEANQLKQDGKKFAKPAQDHMLAGIKTASPVVTKCIDNSRVKTAFRSFAGKPNDKDGPKK